MTASNKPYHCIYHCLQYAVNEKTGLALDESMIQHLLGSYGFRYQPVEECNFPNYTMEEGTQDYRQFSKYTGVDLEIIVESDPLVAFSTTLATLEREGMQLVMANTFYLSFDEKNYRQSNDNHMIIIHQYDREQEVFTVSDYRYQEVTISKENLMLARSSLRDKQFYAIKIELCTQMDRDTVIQNMKEVMLQNVDRFLREDIQTLKRFKDELYLIDSQEGIFKKLAWDYLSKALYHPNGPFQKRALMAKSCQLVDEGVAERFQQLSNKWLHLVKQIIRIVQNVAEFTDLLDVYEEILTEEWEVHMLLRQKLAT